MNNPTKLAATRKSMQESGLTDEEAEEMGIEIIEDFNEVPKDEVSILACVGADEPSRFTDNEFGKCAGCGCGVQFRPGQPAFLIRTCVPCAFTYAQTGRLPQ